MFVLNKNHFHLLMNQFFVQMILLLFVFESNLSSNDADCTIPIPPEVNPNAVICADDDIVPAGPIVLNCPLLVFICTSHNVNKSTIDSFLLPLLFEKSTKPIKSSVTFITAVDKLLNQYYLHHRLHQRYFRLLRIVIQ